MCEMFSQACDAMFHLCRTFEDPDITHVEGDVSSVENSLQLLAIRLLLTWRKCVAGFLIQLTFTLIRSIQLET